MVELADLTDGALVPDAVLAALQTGERAGRSSPEAIKEHLEGRALLLVLDNCEHLIGACASLAAELLAECPDVKMLVTSREPLGIAGETTLDVPPLTLPETATGVPPARETPDSAGPRQEPLQYAAVQLFAERAKAVRPGFEVTRANTSSVVQICRRLDGMPLAIELAAASIRMLSLEQIDARLDDRFELLARARHPGPLRHRTIRTTVDWSHELLSPAERRLFARLSVFPSSFTLAAVEQVCTGEDVEDRAVLDLLSRLVDKSLVTVRLGQGEARYRLLETIREYAREQLGELGDEERLHERHAAHFLSLAEEIEPHLHGNALRGQLERIGPEHDNFRASLGWFARTDSAEAHLRMAAALWRYCYLRGHYREGRGWLRTALARYRTAPPQLAAKALNGVGALALYQCDYDEAESACQESLRIFEWLDDKEGMGWSLTFQGAAARERGDYHRSLDLLRRCQAVFREAGDDWGVAHSLQLLGFAAWLKGDYEDAAGFSKDSLRRFRELGDDERTAWCLLDLGAVEHYRGFGDFALPLLEESLALFQEIVFHEGVAWSYNILGLVERARKDDERAAWLLVESLGLHVQLGDRWRAASVLEALAGVLCTQGQQQRAAGLLGAAGALRETIGTPVPPCESDAYARTLSTLKRGLEQETMRQAWAQGSVLTLHQARQHAAEGLQLLRNVGARAG